ncbi:MAG: hypothetical protein R3B06_27990 [Kofleriaceae bacterium]
MSIPTFDPISGDALASTEALLAAAATASVTAELPLEQFMHAAWLAYTGARPGLRAELELQALREQFAALRARGQLAEA